MSVIKRIIERKLDRLKKEHLAQFGSINSNLDKNFRLLTKSQKRVGTC